jgi:NADP-dependent 3-hydroxy acid dehydrogenase YdfG
MQGRTQTMAAAGAARAHLTHLVTGSTDGIGLHTCKRLVREGEERFL